MLVKSVYVLGLLPKTVLLEEYLYYSKVESRSVMLNLATVVPMEQAALFLIEKPQIAGNACVL